MVPGGASGTCARRVRIPLAPIPILPDQILAADSVKRYQYLMSWSGLAAMIIFVLWLYSDIRALEKKLIDLEKKIDK